MTVEEFREFYERVATGEFMLPELFVINAPTSELEDLGGVANVACHLSHYVSVAQAIQPASHFFFCFYPVGCLFCR